jgi:hypothetical protein
VQRARFASAYPTSMTPEEETCEGIRMTPDTNFDGYDFWLTKAE